MNHNRARQRRANHNQSKKQEPDIGLGGRKKLTSLAAKTTSAYTHRLWTRSVVIVALIVIVYYIAGTEKETRFALRREKIPLRVQKLPCSESYLTEISNYPKCVPKKCGRFVSDMLIDQVEVELMLDVAQKGMFFGGSAGGASILDLHSGALSHGEHFINIFNIPAALDIFKPEHIIAYKIIKAKIRKAIAVNFEIDERQLFLTHPTFFSRINNDSAKTVHDEYWHQHVDKDTYDSFHYTSLLYLNDYGADFLGGRFIFVDGIEGKNRTISSIEPKKGRVSVFTSGSENSHFVQKVTAGIRFAITISFTCNPLFAIEDPTLKYMPRDPDTNNYY